MACQKENERSSVQFAETVSASIRKMYAKKRDVNAEIERQRSTVQQLSQQCNEEKVCVAVLSGFTKKKKKTI